jgi:hypothetical protein
MTRRGGAPAARQGHGLSREPVSMQIQALKLFVTERDVNDLVSKHLPADQPLENVAVRLTPEGVYVTGEYPLFVRVAFETLWEVGVQDRKVIARLVSLKAMGLPATVFTTTVMKALEDAAQKEPWLAFHEDTVTMDVDRLLAQEGIQITTNLTAVRCADGELLVEAAAP